MSAVLPVLFNTGMVRAILDDRKSMTRRIIKFPENRFTGEIPKADDVRPYKNKYLLDKIIFHEEPHYCFDVKTPCQRGDVLYVRETWNKCGKGYRYKTDWEKDGIADITKWKPSIHMSKEAARIFLKVTNICVERLQDITLDDFLNEGISMPDEAFDTENAYLQATNLFADLWNSTVNTQQRALYGWEANPWVWVIAFERCEKPEGWCV